LTQIKELLPLLVDIGMSCRHLEESMTRKIIHIDEELCDGCGQCVPNCPEGALQMVDGKARLVGDLLCDGLGACIGECPAGAITIEEREAEAYDEARVMDNVIARGEEVIHAHLAHLKEHGEQVYLRQALAVLADRAAEGRDLPQGRPAGGCPGSRVRQFPAGGASSAAGCAGPPSQLRQWPVQLHLIPPSAPYFNNADVLLAADCTAYAHGGFHGQFLQGKVLAIACPKLDSNQDIYLDKLKALIDFSGIRSLTVLTMEVPCCGGLLQLARRAARESEREVPIQWMQISVQGQLLREEAVGRELELPSGVRQQIAPLGEESP
jgi:ferredoxin